MICQILKPSPWRDQPEAALMKGQGRHGVRDYVGVRDDAARGEMNGDRGEL